MPRKIDNLAQELARTHQQWGNDQVAQLVRAAQDGPGITRREESKLRQVLEKYVDRMDPAAATALRGFLDGEISAYRWAVGQPRVRLNPWTPTASGVALDPTGVTGPVFISATGAIVTAEGQTAPATPAERADGLYRLARLVDDIPGNVFAPARSNNEKRLFGNLFGEAKVNLELKQKVFTQLSEAMAMVPAGAAPPDGLDAGQALQMRSSAATVLLHLMESLPDGDQAGALKSEALALYRDAAQSETNPVLKESMVFNLYMLRDNFAGDARGIIDELYTEIAPTTPPYDQWFSGSDNTLKVRWWFGQGDKEADDFLITATDSMKSRHGFEIKTDDSGHRVLERTYTVNGVETKVIIDARLSRDSMFGGMDDEDVDVVAYDGHSNIGRNIRESLENARDQQGGKALFIGLCSGKDGLFRMRDRYPEAHVITTFDSSYYGGWGEAENSQALSAMFEGVAARKGWEALSKDINENVRWSHPLPYNYMTPVHTMVRRRLLDQDHDGQADVLDRLVDFNLIKPEESTRREFQPVRPTHAIDRLDGTTIHTAAQTINTLVHYNDTISEVSSLARVVSGGFFAPGPGEENTIVRFTEDTRAELAVKGRSDTETTIKMEVNGNFSHMSEEALRAVACYEYAKFLAKNDPDGFFGAEYNWPDGLTVQGKTELMALTFAGSNLIYDLNGSYFGVNTRDGQVWNALTEHAGLPRISPDELFTFLNGIGGAGDHHHDYTGSVRVVKKFIELLSEEQLEALNGED